MSVNNNLMDELGVPGEYRQDPRERLDPRQRLDNREISADARVPMGGNKLKMTLPEIPGFRTRWFNDAGDRIETAKKGGYTHIIKAGIKVGSGSETGHTDLGSVVSMVVGTQANGQPLRAYGMKIKQEWFIEDQAKQALAIRETETQIRGGQLPGDKGDTSNRYVPEQGISIEEG